MRKNTKRILASLTAAAALSSVCCAPFANIGINLPISPIEAQAAETKTSGDYQYTLETLGAVITKYTGSAAELTIPAKLDGYTVCGIGNGAFENNKTLTSVTLHSGILTIDNYAFYNCSALTSVSFNEGLTTIGDYAFTKTALTEAALPSTIKTAPYAFSGTPVTKASFAEGAEEVPARIFENCHELTEVTLPKTITDINNSAFYNCTSLSKFTFHEGITFIGDYAFTKTAITEAALPSTIKTASYAFSGTPITKASFAEGTEEVPARIFENCKELSEVTLPNTITDINNSAFYNCTSLSKFTFHEGITFIGDYAFTKTAITEAALPSTIKTAAYAFSGTGITKASFAEGTAEVPARTFENCKQLKEVTLPESITDINNSAFYNCTSLANFKFHEGITFIGDYSFSKTAVTEAVLPSTLKTAAYAFSGSNLAKVSFADGIETIPSRALENAFQLKEVTLPESVKEIDNSAFENCTHLRSIKFPSSLEEIGSYAFYKSGLRSLEIPDSVTKAGLGAFSNCKELKTVVVGSGLTELSENLFTSCVSLEKATLTAKKTEANSKAFFNCRSLSELDYSKTELEFKTLTFEKCYSLKDMDLVFLKRPASTMTITTEKAAVNGTVDFTVDFDVIAGHYLDSTDFTVALTIPEGVTVLSDSFKTDAGEVSMNAISELKIPFDKSKGKLTFSARATEPGTYDIDAELIFKDADKNLGTRREPIHSVRFTADILSLSAPSTVNSLETKVSGTGPKGQKVDVYLGDKVIGSPVADEKTGKFELAVELPESKDGDKFVIKAKYGDVETSEHTIVYSKKEPAINSIKLGINGNDAERDITDVFTKCTSPVMYIDTGREYSFALDISNSDNVDRVFITSTKEDKIAKLEAKYDEDTKLWCVKGYFDGNKNYVPGTLNIVVVSKSKADELKSAKLNIDYKDAYYSRQGNIKFVIDPSGIVYEGAPSNAVKGAEMTIYYMDEDGKAVVWDGTDFDQKNPVLTDEFGAYVWDVPEGDWKVVCKAEGFETAESDWTEVPPAQKDINFSLVSSAAPKVTDIALDGKDISLKFSKYMIPDTVNVGNVALDAGSDIQITPVYHADGENITDTFTISGDFTDVYDVKVSVSDGCHSYSDAAAVAYEKTVHIKDNPNAATTTTTTTAKTTTTTTTKATTTTTKATTTTTKATTTTTKATTTTTKATTTTTKATTTTAKPTTTTTKATTTTAKPTTTTTKATTTTAKPTTTTTKATTTTAKPATTTTTKATTTTAKPTTTTTKATTTTAVTTTVAATTTAPVTTTQPVTKKALGDIDGNGRLDAVDASKILGSYAKYSTGAAKPTQDDIDVCDVNRDGYIDAVDASKVLSYYAYLSTTKDEPMSLESFVKKQQK